MANLTEKPSWIPETLQIPTWTYPQYTWYLFNHLQDSIENNLIPLEKPNENLAEYLKAPIYLSRTYLQSTWYLFNDLRDTTKTHLITSEKTT